MALYHCHIDHYRRSEGRSSIGGAAYRRGIKAKCAVTGKHFDFRKKEEVVYSEFVPAFSTNGNTILLQSKTCLKKLNAQSEEATQHWGKKLSVLCQMSFQRFNKWH